MDAKSIAFSAPGKVILFGEHSVVYGHPAIATAIDLRAKCELKKTSEKAIKISTPNLFPDKIFTIFQHSLIPSELEPFKHICLLISDSKKNIPAPEVRITSTIPPSSGLGSSAATAVSLTASLLKFYEIEYSLERICDIAFESEKITHGSPSGIDNSISTYGGGIFYEKGKITTLTAKIPSSFLVIINSLVSRSTKNLVEQVQKKKENEPNTVQSIFKGIENITRDAKKQLELGHLEEIGNLLNANHELLEQLGVGHPTLTKIVNIIDRYHALGRKLTGAGGGGCIIALFDKLSVAKELAINLATYGFPSYVSNIFEIGVKIEE